jgi:hypothetical protein
MATIDEITRHEGTREGTVERDDAVAGRDGFVAARDGFVAAPARAALRGQIARLEAELAALVAATYPRPVIEPVGGVGGPRLLSLCELERVRDALVARLRDAQRAAAAREVRQAQARAELAAMLADPPAHKWRRLSNADLGRRGCTTYHVRPRAGLLGMLMGWWQVKVSGGCP